MVTPPQLATKYAPVQKTLLLYTLETTGSNLRHIVFDDVAFKLAIKLLNSLCGGYDTIKWA